MESAFHTLIWVLPFGMIISTLAGLWYLRDGIIEVGREVANRKIFVDAGDIHGDASSLDEPDTPQVLGRDTFKEAVGSLIQYAREVKPDWIVGVHPGGRLLSVYVADALSMDSTRCAFLSTSKDRSPQIRFDPHPNLMSGNVLVIDDIVRTGKTLRAVKSYLESVNFTGGYELSSVKFAALTVTDDPHLWFVPHWAKFKTENSRLLLPWTQLSQDIGAAFAAKTANWEYVEAHVEFHERLVREFAFALEWARFYIDGIGADGGVNLVPAWMPNRYA